MIEEKESLKESVVQKNENVSSLKPKKKEERKRPENETSRNREQKKKKIVLSSRPKTQRKILSSRLKISRNFRSKKDFLIQYSGQRDSIDWRICVQPARNVESFCRDFPVSVPSGILSVADSENV